jgi:hypothetical protein
MREDRARPSPRTVTPEEIARDVDARLRRAQARILETRALIEGTERHKRDSLNRIRGAQRLRRGLYG